MSTAMSARWARPRTARTDPGCSRRDAAHFTVPVWDRAEPMGEFYLEHEYTIASTQLILAMLGMGATLRVSDFLDVLRYPRAIFVGIGTQILVVPMLAFAVGRAFGLEPGLAVGLVLVAAVPGGTMSNVLTYFAKGNVPLSISLTAVCTIGSLVTTPLVLSALSASHLPGSIDMPVGRISREISLCLLGPLFLGMIIGNAIGDHREVFSRWAIRASLVAIVVLIAGAASADRIDPLSHGASAVAAITLFTILACAAGFGLCVAAGLGAADRTAVAIEASFRNTSLALMVKALVFPVVPGVADPMADGVFYVALLYGGVAFQVALVPLVWNRRKTAAAVA